MPRIGGGTSGRVRRLRLTTLVVAAAVTPIMAVVNQASASPRTGEQTTGLSASIPGGWKTLTFGQASISVPPRWAVKHNTNCPTTDAPGALLLGGAPTSCPAYRSGLNAVSVTTIPADVRAGSPPTGAVSRTVNGVPIWVQFGSPISLVWLAPSLGVEISASGSQASRILQTLRRAHRSASNAAPARRDSPPTHPQPRSFSRASPIPKWCPTSCTTVRRTRFTTSWSLWQAPQIVAMKMVIRSGIAAE